MKLKFILKTKHDKINLLLLSSIFFCFLLSTISSAETESPKHNVFSSYYLAPGPYAKFDSFKNKFGSQFPELTLATIIQDNTQDTDEYARIVTNHEQYNYLCQRALDLNVLLLIAYPSTDARLPKFLKDLIDVLESIPPGILSKAKLTGKPIVFKIGEIANKSNLDETKTDRTMGAINIGLTQLSTLSMPVFCKKTSKSIIALTKKQLEKTVIHAMIGHKLALMRYPDGSLLLPKQNWIKILKINKGSYLRSFLSEEKRREWITDRLTNDLKHINYYTKLLFPFELERMDDATFCWHIKNIVGSRNRFLYYGNVHEIVAYTLEGLDLARTTEKTAAGNYLPLNATHLVTETNEILMRNLLREDIPLRTNADGSIVYRTWTYNGEGWQQEKITFPPGEAPVCYSRSKNIRAQDISL